MPKPPSPTHSTAKPTKPARRRQTTAGGLDSAAPVRVGPPKVRADTSALASAISSEPDQVDAYLKKQKHPLMDVVVALRRIILSVDQEIGEGIWWNSPAFIFIGNMRPFKPKEYRRHLVVFNLYRQDCIRLVFPSGAKVDDQSGFLEGDYADGRRLALFHDLKEVGAKERALKSTIKRWLKLVER